MNILEITAKAYIGPGWDAVTLTGNRLAINNMRDAILALAEADLTDHAITAATKAASNPRDIFSAICRALAEEKPAAKPSAPSEEATADEA
jgi:hypothetical protein